MADDTKQSGEVYLRNVRLSFPHIFQKSASVDGGKERFRASFIIDPEEPEGAKNVKRIEKAIADAEQEKFGKTNVKYKEDRLAFVDGDDCISGKTQEPYDGYPGKKIVKAGNDERPTLRDKKKRPVAEEDGVLYAGCRVDAIVRFFGINDKNKGGTGMFASLEGIMFRADDEAFRAGSSVSDDDFDDIPDDDDDEDVV